MAVRGNVAEGGLGEALVHVGAVDKADLRAARAAAAVEAWERACKLDPDHSNARAHLAALRRADGRVP